jgi:hypothetical protein
MNVTSSVDGLCEDAVGRDRAKPGSTKPLTWNYRRAAHSGGDCLAAGRDRPTGWVVGDRLCRPKGPFGERCHKIRCLGKQASRWGHVQLANVFGDKNGGLSSHSNYGWGITLGDRNG